jgi:inner membrane protein
MFVALTFLSLFMTVFMTKRAFHPIQYALIGLALVLFYTLLLSLSEQVQFNIAYLITSAAIIILVAGYVKSIASNLRVSVVIAGILGLLYGFMFVLLQLEDYALLLGSAGLFAILATIMYLTRKIDWFALGKVTETKYAQPGDIPK